jgi:hypothetical protein
VPGASVGIARHLEIDDQPGGRELATSGTMSAAHGRGAATPVPS